MCIVGRMSDGLRGGGRVRQTQRGAHKQRRLLGEQAAPVNLRAKLRSPEKSVSEIMQMPRIVQHG